MSPGSDGPRIMALVAAYNEADTIGATARTLAGVEGVDDIVVVADGSTDGTGRNAVAAGARVLVASRRKGKGSALESALGRLPPADVYVLVDGDVGETASEADRLLRTVLAGRADLAIGCLPALGGGGFGLVKSFARWAIRTLSGFDAEEPLSGQRVITSAALSACRPLAAGFGLETAMTIDAVRRGFRVLEVSVDMRHRPTGRSVKGFAHRGRQGWHIMRAVVGRARGAR